MSTMNQPLQQPRGSALAFLGEAARRCAGQATIVGKGPSFAEFDRARHGQGQGRFVIGLNEVSLRVPCDAAFILDADILEKSARDIAGSGIQALITARVPHRPTGRVGGLVLYGPGDTTAEAATWRGDFGERLRTFNLSTTSAEADLGPVIQAGNFSAPILAELLAQAGFHDILLAGIDGGSSYSAAFDDVAYKKLRSVQNSFDSQFAELRGVRDRHGVVFRSVRCSEASILIGTDTEQCLATEVLKWSIESNTFLTVRYTDTDTRSRSLYAHGDVGTPFSLQRIFLPEMAGHRGRGVYFDSDMLVFRDVYELFNADMADRVLLGCAPTPGRRTQFSVFLVDNERADWDAGALVQRYLAGEVSYDWLMKEFAFVERRGSTLPTAWNSLEMYEPGVTANIHFTDMGTQPWLSVYNPNADLWCEALFRALQERPAVGEALHTSLARGWVRPSLGWQVEQRQANPWRLPASAKALDAGWLPPHERLKFPDAPPRMQLLKWRLASHVRRAIQSRAYIRLLKAGHALKKVF